MKEYELTPSSLDWWINQNHTSGSFKEKDIKTAEQQTNLNRITLFHTN